tara:strand:+ start:140 stop:373 length:234 start_codon:yes stop_codon:yes gene_type:complete
MIRVVPDWREMGLMLRWIVMCAFIGFMLSLIVVACSEDIYIGGYNKNMEEIHRQFFVVDSLIMDLNLTLDTLNAKGY